MVKTFLQRHNDELYFTVDYQFVCSRTKVSGYHNVHGFVCFEDVIETNINVRHPVACKMSIKQRKTVAYNSSKKTCWNLLVCGVY